MNGANGMTAPHPRDVRAGDCDADRVATVKHEMRVELLGGDERGSQRLAARRRPAEGKVEDGEFGEADASRN